MDIVINQTSNEPIYTQIFSQISSQIISGKLKPGEKLPAIRQISNQLRISVIPVKMGRRGEADHRDVGDRRVGPGVPEVVGASGRRAGQAGIYKNSYRKRNFCKFP